MMARLRTRVAWGEWRRPLTIALLAAVLYASLVGWGVPYATAPDRIKTTATDEILPLEGLAEMRSTFISAAPDRNLGYPWLHYAVVSAAQAPYLAWLIATGGMSAPAAEYPYGLKDPVTALKALTVLGRLASVLMAAGAVVAAFAFTASLWGRTAATWAALLAALSYPAVYYSRTGNLDMPAYFWSAAAIAVIGRTFSGGLTTSRAVWLGIFSAAAVATKDQMLILFVPLLAGLALPQWHRPTGTGYPVRPLLTLVASGLVAYAVATGMLVDPGRHVAHLQKMIFTPQAVSVSLAYMPAAPNTWTGLWSLVTGFVQGLLAMMSPPVLVLAVAGLALAIRADRRHLVWVAALLLHFVVLVRGIGGVEQRYLLPFTIAIDAFAALCLLRMSAWRREVALALFAVCIAWRGAVAADLTWAQWRDSRLPAADFLRKVYAPGDRIEYFGVTEALPPLDADMVSRRIMGREQWAGTFGHGPAVLDYLRREGPRFIVIVPDWSSGRTTEYSGDCPPEVFEALTNGSVGYRLAAHFTTPSLLPGVLARPRLDYQTVAPPIRIFVRDAQPAGSR